MRFIPLLIFVMGALSLFIVQTAGVALWPYQRTSVDMCSASTHQADAATDLRQHLETGWELEHTQISHIGQFECSTYFLRRH